MSGKKREASERLRAYYAENPLMVSSPFGGVDGVNRELFDHVFSVLSVDLRGRRVLDVGCGRGYVREVVADGGGSYVGLDLVANGSGFPLVTGDGAALPFPDASFDAVTCMDVFEHFPDGAAAAREFRRTLRPGGFVFLSAPNYANIAGVVKFSCEVFGRYDRHTWAPFRGWQPQELEMPLTAGRIRRVFAAAGFSSHRRMPHAAEVGLGLFPWIEHPRMPESVKFRLQRWFGKAGPLLVKLCPAASLHSFWRFGVD